MGWITMGSCVALGAAVVALWVGRDAPDRVDRFFMQDQQHFERLEAYRALEELIKEADA